jgi:hypothetical protein
MRASVEKDKRWVTIAFTWNGLRAVGVDEGSLSTFPEEFRQGMAARAEILGDTGGNAPENWVGELASPDLHAIAILFARDAAEHALKFENERTRTARPPYACYGKQFYGCILFLTGANALGTVPASTVRSQEFLMLVRLSMVLAVICMLSGAALAQGAAKLTDAQIAHIAYTAGQLDIEGAKQAISNGARPYSGE